ncbi:MAG: DUF971 domain-containing protein [Dehalococcoidia bacterium]|nr:DUF971 domain-containing protein [Dehalococcoidia bacterium]MQG00163.1 DUF971 domain-containing protein [SAR202 cluster bacterium]
MGVQDVKLDSDYITILWDDGHEGIYPSRYLRGYCCCAACVEEMTGRRIVGENDVDEYVMALDWIQIGRYALQFLWSDAHDSGIYPFEVLRNLCRCEECYSQ